MPYTPVGFADGPGGGTSINAASLAIVEAGISAALRRGETTTLPDSLTTLARIDIPDDASPTASWPDRLAFYFDNSGTLTRTGYHNEYGELRARPAKTSTVAFRAQAHASGSSGDILQVTNSSNATVYLGVSSSRITLHNGVQVHTGTGSPEGVVTAPVSSTYHRTDGSSGTCFYVKESGSGNTGWVAK